MSTSAEAVLPLPSTQGDSPSVTTPAKPTEAAVGFRPQLTRVLHEALGLSLDLIEADYGVIAEPVAGGESLLLRTLGRETNGSHTRVLHELLIDIDGNMAGQALASGNAVTTQNLAEDSRYRDDPLRRYDAGGVLMMPLVSDSEAVCVLGLIRTQARDFLLNEVITFSQIIQPLIPLVVMSVDSTVLACQAGSKTSPKPPDSPRPGRKPQNAAEAPANHQDFRNQVLAGRLTPPAGLRNTAISGPKGQGKQGAECRASRRHEYRYTQWIAPIRSWAKPSAADFVEVQCGDLSAGGFSMWLNYLPDFRELVLALGKPPSVAHIRARIVHTREVLRGNGRWYQVGCQFLERVSL